MRIGSQALSTLNAEVDLFNIAADGPACSKSIVKNRSGSANVIGVRCPQLGHTTATTGFQLAAGESVVFERGTAGVPGINQVIVWLAATGSATADCAILAQ
jgi:hypothetical protein